MKLENNEDNRISYLDNKKSFMSNKNGNENFLFSSNQNLIEIKDNYLTEPTQTGKSIFPADYFPVNEHAHQPKLYEQLMGTDRQKSFGYNTLVLLCFNINVAHFCFPYITYKCGILLTFIILLLCGFFSYLVQSSLIRYISQERGVRQCNYAVIIENNFGSFCASFLEASVLVWYGIILLVCLYTDEEYILYTNISYFFFVVVIFLILNRINSSKMIDFDVFFCIGVHFLSLIFYIFVFIERFSDNPESGDLGDLFKFNDREFYDSFNIFSGSLNTIIIFFWVYHKFSDSSMNKQNGMFNASFGYVIIYYILFIFLKFFPIDRDGVIKRFLLVPDFKHEKFPVGSNLYYFQLTEIILNIVNQIFMLNFYFLVMKSLIFRPKLTEYFKKKYYWLWYSFYILIIAGLSFIQMSPYSLLIINNATAGFVVNFLIPTLLFIKLSSDNFFSFQIMTNMILVFIFSVISLTSFYKILLSHAFFSEKN